MSNRKLMKHKGFFARIMEAQRLVGDHVFGLPPGSALDVYHVDEFNEVPGNWIKGAGSFVVPVRPNKGLWFDWTPNSGINTAVLPTVKGCNPITGLKTSGYHLERYENNCPKHGCEFHEDRYCKECGYKWPPQNYVSYPNTLWWDGFRTGDKVRQFFFTEDMIRDVATSLIGKEETVPAFGFAFYNPKEKRDYVTYRSTYSDSGASIDYKSLHVNYSGTPYIYGSSMMGGVETNCECSYKSETKNSSFIMESYTSKEENTTLLRSMSKTYDRSRSIAPKKEVAVGAGAEIRQELRDDPYALDSWKDTPEATMVIYFIFEKEFQKMKEAGMKDFSEKKDGMLSGIPVG